VFSFASPANNVTSQRARVGRETAIIAALYWDELLIFLQNALISTAGTRDVLRMTGNRPRTSGILPHGSSGSIASEPATSSFFGLPARRRAASTVSSPHHLDRDEEGK
jgi:hypothetical protein